MFNLARYKCFITRVCPRDLKLMYEGGIIHLNNRLLAITEQLKKQIMPFVCAKMRQIDRVIPEE